MSPPLARTADAVVMVRPKDFGFNEETAADNEFQTRPAVDSEEINRRANLEFQEMVDRLRAEGVEVLLLESDPTRKVKLPDAVFPNNWFSTTHDGTLIIYPMMAVNRRAERRVEDLKRLLQESGRRVENVLYIGREDENEFFLEGTGALVIDHRTQTVYAARSLRCHPLQLENFVRLRSLHKAFLFDAVGSSGRPLYHTNMMMSLGEQFTVICTESIVDPAQRRQVLESLRRSFEIIEVSREQMEKHFCGNILQLRDGASRPLIVMSARAEQGFTARQRQRLAEHGRIVSVNLETIETVGGGSARCMLAEVFLPRK